jgi:hypothetical protein
MGDEGNPLGARALHVGFDLDQCRGSLAGFESPQLVKVDIALQVRHLGCACLLGLPRERFSPLTDAVAKGRSTLPRAYCLSTVTLHRLPSTTRDRAFGLLIVLPSQDRCFRRLGRTAGRNGCRRPN